MLPADETTYFGSFHNCPSFPVVDYKTINTIIFRLDRRAGTINRGINLKAEKELE
jgi:hypothetical protein